MQAVQPAPSQPETLPPDGRRLVAERLAALAHPARIEIIQHLARRDACCNKDVVDRMALAQSTVSQHLKVLQRIDLLEATSQHTRMIYRLRQDRLRNFCRAFQQTLGTHDCENGTQSGGMDAAGMLMP